LATRANSKKKKTITITCSRNPRNPTQELTSNPKTARKPRAALEPRTGNQIYEWLNPEILSNPVNPNKILKHTKISSQTKKRSSTVGHLIRHFHFHKSNPSQSHLVIKLFRAQTRIPKGSVEKRIPRWCTPEAKVIETPGVNLGITIDHANSNLFRASSGHTSPRR
jgi:hypothetical protein